MVIDPRRVTSRNLQSIKILVYAMQYSPGGMQARNAGLSTESSPGKNFDSGHFELFNFPIKPCDVIMHKSIGVTWCQKKINFLY